MKTTVLKMGTGRSTIDEIQNMVAESKDHRLHNLIVPFTTMRRTLNERVLAVTLQYHEPDTGEAFYSASFMDQDDFTYLIFERSTQHMQLIGMK